MLIKTIYHSNMLAAFLALWKHTPQTRQMASLAVPKEKSSSAAGGDPSRTSDKRSSAAGGRSQAAGDRSGTLPPAPKVIVGEKRKNEDSVPGKNKRVKKGEKKTPTSTR